MGKNSRARHAAKARKQQRPASRPTQPAASSSVAEPDLVSVLFQAGQQVARGNPLAAEECALAVLRSGTWSGAEIQKTLRAVVADAQLHTWRRGWQPIDLHHVIRRRLSPEHLSLYVTLLVESMRTYATATVDPRWLDQVADLSSPSGSQGGARRGPPDAISAITTGLELFGLLSSLDRITVLMPVPGTASANRHKAGPVDQKVLAKVRALLAKAESTEFDEEADALSAKAQELMTRYSLERHVVEANDHAEQAGARRIWLEAPYAGAKAMLAHVVAEANRCLVVWSDDPGFVTIIGDDYDLAATELLATSLLVQATRAMVHATPRDQKRSFRQSFLVAYAGRIGERLRDADVRTTQDVRSDTGADLVPVLAALRERVESAKEELFPRTTAKRVSVSNGYGYAAGRAAADLAALDSDRTPLR